MKGFFLIFLLVGQLFAHTVERSTPIQYQFPVSENASGITEDNLKTILTILDQEFGNKIGNKKISWMRDVTWDNPYIGAGSNQIDGDFYILLFGGLVRAKYVTIGALSAIICHELGHKLGGEPHQKFPDQPVHWSSSEGQADMFSAGECLPTLYDGLLAQAPQLLNYESEPEAEIRCRKNQNPERCRWVATSGIDFIQSMQVYFEVDIPLADPAATATEKPVQTLHTAYPSYQCRMDIYKSAAEDAKAPRLRCWYAN